SRDDAGGVDHRVDSAEALDRRGDGVAHRVLIRHVELHRLLLPAQLFFARRDLRLAAGASDNLRAGLSHRHCDGPADAAGPAGHEHDFAADVQAFVHGDQTSTFLKSEISNFTLASLAMSAKASTSAGVKSR